eukprot:s1225_g16.t1
MRHCGLLSKRRPCESWPFGHYRGGSQTQVRPGGKEDGMAWRARLEWMQLCGKKPTAARLEQKSLREMVEKKWERDGFLGKL